MIITISGIAGSGKSTVAKILAKKMGFRHYSVGDLMREMAREKGVSLLELGKLAEKDMAIDMELDDRQIELGKREDNFVIDSRLGFHFIPGSVKVFLDVELNEAAKRILNEGRKHESYKDIKESVKKIKERIASEDKRYKSYYKLNYRDKKYYSLVIDTTDSMPDAVAEKIILFLKQKKA